jgi:hypothetical protein
MDENNQNQTTQENNVQSQILMNLNPPTWLNLWKEVLGYSYVLIMVYDFVIAPITMQIYIAAMKLPPNVFTWEPLTLKSGGLFYVSMATILGVAGYSQMVKTRELIKNM